MLGVGETVAPAGAVGDGAHRADFELSVRRYLPLLARSRTWREPTPTPTPVPSATPTATALPSPTPTPTCEAVGGDFPTVRRLGARSPVAVEDSPEFNLALRGWVSSGAALGLVDYGGGTDPDAPFLGDMLPGRIGSPVRFTSAHQVREWDYGAGRPGPPIPAHPFPATLVGLATRPGDTVHLPGRRAAIDGNGTRAMVVFAGRQRVTLKYTREEIEVREGVVVISGYMVHVEDICTDPRLLALYQSLDRAGREHLPAIRSGQAFARALGSEVRVAVRDTGRFMDPRARKDWWRGLPWWW